jgi:adenine phosphoribosyltransferase
MSADLRALVRDVPDFPKPGILFRDLTPLMRDPAGWQEVVRQLAAVCQRLQPDLIVGIESRGFIVGTALATAVQLGFVPVRKPGRLPGTVTGVDYALEYGTDRLEIHSEALAGGEKVLIVDDLLATGGTADATCKLIRKLGGEVVACVFVVELGFLDGRDKLGDVPVESVIIF